MKEIFFGPFGFAFSSILGLFIGSFLNVCIARWPRNQSVIKPASHCPQCQSPVAWHDNIPVLSWIFLGARCRQCSQLISPIYPSIELITGISFGLIHQFFSYNLETQPLSDHAWIILLLMGWLFVALTIIVTVVDIRHLIIPDEISLNLMPLGPLLAFFFPELMSKTLFFDVFRTASFEYEIFTLAARETDWLNAVANSLGGVTIGYLSLWLLAEMSVWWFKKEGMGMGDIKLLATLGGFLGVEGTFVTLIIASFLGMVIGVFVWILTRSRKIPFGPWLMLGGLLTYLFKAPLIIFLLQANRDLLPKF